MIRYDHRDTGRSTSCPVGSPSYTFEDLIADSVAVLDAFGITRAHLVGLSMGGGIAQCVAIDRPERVATLTLMSTGPVGPVTRELPGMAPELVAHESVPRDEPDWTDRTAVIDHLIADLKAYTGSLRFDESGLRALVERVVDRTGDMHASQTNHAVLGEDDHAPERRLDQVVAPTLVLHGTRDPLFPAGYAEALVEEIADARLVWLAGVGHEYPPRAVWDLVISSIADHTDR